MKKCAFLILSITIGCSGTKDQKTTEKDDPVVLEVRNSKMNGANLEMPPNPIQQSELNEIRDLNVEWVAVIPYAFSMPGQTFVNWGYKQQWWGESMEGTIAIVQMAHQANLKVMLKPHVWVGEGQGWLGDFDFEEDTQWEAWENAFHDYVMAYAHVADSLDVAMICIGTEARKSAAKRPEFWKGLIADIREIYTGDLTYAANWDNYMNVSFWGDLDYIGVDAYFPLSDKPAPTRQELLDSWKVSTSKLKKLSEEYGRQVILTEFGYKSIEYTNSGHWKYREDTVKTSNATQATAYEALFSSLWQQDFIEGGFFWKWHFDDMRSRRNLSRRYTPQGKPAEEIVKREFAN